MQWTDRIRQVKIILVVAAIVIAVVSCWYAAIYIKVYLPIDIFPDFANLRSIEYIIIDY